MANLVDYIDKFGFVSPYVAGEPSGNGPLYTAELIRAKSKQGVTSEWAEMVIGRFFACQLPGYAGLMKRNPEDPGQERADNYYGHGTAADVLCPDLACDILQHGKRERWLGVIPTYIYNNVNPGKWTWDSWMGKYPALIAHLHYAARLKPSWFSRIWLGVSFLFTKFFIKWSDDNAWALSWHLYWTTMSHGGPVVRWTARQWYKTFRKYYVNGLSTLREKYFTFRHPVCEELELFEKGES